MEWSITILLLRLLLNPASTSDASKVDQFLSMWTSTTGFQQQNIDIDFENGLLKPWRDCSEDGSQWIIENMSSRTTETIEGQMSPPPLEIGTHFLWLDQDFETSGIGILCSPTFLAYPEDEINISFWISSFRHFNNIQILWSAADAKENKNLTKLYPTSSISENTKWRRSYAKISISKPTKGEIMIYGFCDPSGGGFIAVDNIFLIRKSTVSTTLHAPTTNFTPVDDTKETQVSKSPLINPKIATLEMQSSIFTTDVSLASTISTENEECPFGPCEICYPLDVSTYNVICRDISTKTLRDEYFQELDENSYDFDWFEITPLFNDSIPFDMFASSIRYVNWFTINCDYISNLYEVDPFAFKPNLDVTNMIFKNCNFANLTFLSQLRSLRDLTFRNSSNLNDILKSLPSDLKLHVLRIESCYLLELTIDNFPPLSTGLKELRIVENQEINDDIVGLFLSWALDFSRDSLTNFYIYNNGLKKIPIGLSRFNSLAFFKINSNLLEPGIVKKGELKFSDYTRLVDLRFCGIHTIEAGAFSGIYEMANVYLDGNSLTRFDSDVYHDILGQMAKLGDLEDGGFINIEGNRFDCVEDPCHLTWLLRDHRNFLPFIWNAACANGILFEDIQPDDPIFNGCP